MKAKYLPAKCKRKFGHLNLLFLCAIFIICGLFKIHFWNKNLSWTVFDCSICS